MALLTDNVNLHRGVIHKLHLKEFLHLPHKENTHEEQQQQQQQQNYQKLHWIDHNLETFTL